MASTPYITLADLSGKIPTSFLVQALDDDGDGIVDAAVWSTLVDDVHLAIDGALGARYPVPFGNPLPPVVVHAARVLACEALYQRRGFGTRETNPWRAAGDAVRTDLAKIGNGDLPLQATTRRATPPASAITETAPTTSARGRRLV